MTPTTLPRLSGLLHHLPDARDLRVLGADGTTAALSWQALEVYAAVPGLVERVAQLEREVQEDAQIMVGTMAAASGLRAALRLPDSAPWADVVATAHRLAGLDPGRTLDGETEVGDV